MTSSIFDSTTGNAERTGTRFTPPDAIDSSLLPEIYNNPPHISPSGVVDFHPPIERPAIDVTPVNGGKVLMIELSGKLHKYDYHHFVPVVEKAVKENGKVRMLVQMIDFHGWDFDGLWEDVKFDAGHYHDIERIAIVGDTDWEKWMALFCWPFTAATIRYFSEDRLAEAKTWIGAA